MLKIQGGTNYLPELINFIDDCELLLNEEHDFSFSTYQHSLEQLKAKLSHSQNENYTEAKNKLILGLINLVLTTNKEFTAFDLKFSNQILKELGFKRFTNRQAVKIVLKKLKQVLESAPKKVISSHEVVFAILVSLHQSKERIDRYMLDFFVQRGIDAECIDYLVAKKYVSLYPVKPYPQRYCWSILRDVIHNVLTELVSGQATDNCFLYQLKVEMSLPFAKQIIAHCREYEALAKVS